MDCLSRYDFFFKRGCKIPPLKAVDFMDKSGVSKEVLRKLLWHDLAPFMEPYLAIALRAF